MANALRSKTREMDIQFVAQSIQADILILTETEVPENSSLTISGYTSFYPPPHQGKFRLVAMVGEALTPLVTIVHCSPMAIFLRVALKSPLLVVGVYRQWGGNENAALAEFHNECAKHCIGIRALAIGDFNLDTGRVNDMDYSRRGMLVSHLKAMSCAGLDFVGPHTPTYHSHGHYGAEKEVRHSTLDHVYTSSVKQSDVFVSPFAATDHNPIFIRVPCSKRESNLICVSRRNLNRLDSLSLCQEIDKNLPTDLYERDNVDDILKMIVNAIIAALDKLAPVRRVMVREGGPLFSLAPDTLKMMNLRDEAAKRGSKAQYRSLRNAAARLVRRDKLRSSLSSIGKAKDNPKKLWHYTNQVLGKGPSKLPPKMKSSDGDVSGAEEIASMFNQFFIDKVDKVREGIPRASPVTLAGRSGVTDFKFKFPTAGKIAKIIRGLSNTSAIGVDGVPMRALKLGAPVLSDPIGHLVRQSLRTGIVPAGFKVASVRPLHKGKGKDIKAPTSYRPVSILSVLSKVLEKVVHESLVEHLVPLLPPAQFGFRPGRSTTSAINYTHGAWTALKAEGKVVGVAAYDMSAAFDTLDVAKLGEKLEVLGVKGLANKWFSSYLLERRQCVDNGGSKSSFLPLKYGVPQGSILGPVLFLALMYDMPDYLGINKKQDVGFTGYADDIVLWCAHKSADKVKQMLECMSERVYEYTAANYLALNTSKTQVMFAGARGYSVKVGEDVVTPSEQVEVLGVAFDKLLRPLPFLKAQEKAAAKITGAIRRLSYHLPPSHTAPIARGLLNGKVGYASAVLKPRMEGEDPLEGPMANIQRAVNECARTILGAHRADRVPRDVLLKKTGLISLNHMVIKSVCLEAWKALKLGCPERDPLTSLLVPSVMGDRVTRRVTDSKLPPPLKRAARTFIWEAYQTWNSFPNLRNAKSEEEAKRVCRTVASLSPL